VYFQSKYTADSAKADPGTAQKAGNKKFKKVMPNPPVSNLAKTSPCHVFLLRSYCPSATSSGRSERSFSLPLRFISTAATR
jgi:hypothetical protein